MTGWRREMLRAVCEAAAESALFKGSSLSNGLRCIRTFERVNATAFDPFNRAHRDTVRGMGVHEELFRVISAQGIPTDRPRRETGSVHG